MKCGLLGRKLGHSYSPQIHALLGDYEYVLYEIEPENLGEFLRKGDFSGLNVTMPYKAAVIPYLDELTPEADQLGAVNTIVRRDGRLVGHNTDYFGFSSLLQRSGFSPAGKKCLVLGSGGASKVAQFVLKEQKACVTVISRSGDENYKTISRHQDASFIINTTPVGMYPQTGVSPVEQALFPTLEGVIDVVYNPARTHLLLEAERRGIPAVSGLWMLVAQAKEAAQWFTGAAIAEEKISEIYQKLARDMENIILIGMPGCGKSTVGRLLSQKTGRKFVDCDAFVENLAQKSIPRMITEDGEAAFRTLESHALAEIGKESGLVIATGGGCVTRAENYAHLHQNGRIFWLQRDTETLVTEGRPLSVNLQQLYRDRERQYAAFADHILDNNGTPKEAADAILEVFF